MSEPSNPEPPSHTPVSKTAHVPSRPDRELLLCALRAGIGSGEDLPRDGDWARLIDNCPATLRPFLGHSLQLHLESALIPPELRTALAGTTRANAALHMLRQRELRQISQVMERRSIPVVALKGVALAHLAYPSPATRPMVDMDFLIPADRWPDARDGLFEIGLRIPDRWQVRPRTGVMAKAESDLPFERPGTPILIELHTDLETTRVPFSQSIESVWTDSEWAELGGVRTRVLSPQHALAHIAIHLSSQTRFAHGLLATLDITLLLERLGDRFDWPRFAGDCVAYGHAKWMFVSLKLARDLLHAPVPQVFFECLPTPLHLDELEALATEQLFCAQEDRVPRVFTEVLATAPRERARRIVGRLNPWRRQELVSDAKVNLVAGAVKGLRRLWLDLKIRVPRYVTAWRGGQLKGSTLRRAVDLEKGRRRIDQLIASGVGDDTPPSST